MDARKEGTTDGHEKYKFLLLWREVIKVKQSKWDIGAPVRNSYFIDPLSKRYLLLSFGSFSGSGPFESFALRTNYYTKQSR